MKLRKGFVSNSSSSSFIVLLTEEDKKLLKIDYKTTEHEYVFNKDQWNCGFAEKEGWYLSESKDDDTTPYDVWAKEISLAKVNETGLGRCTAIGYGKELIDYIKELKEYEYTKEIGEGLEVVVNKYGIDNVLYLRESDEEMGGNLPPELRNLTLDNNKVLYHEEYH